jgi:single-stranded DNA-binding protein
MNEKMKNNNVLLTGKIVSEPEYSHEVYGEQFFNLFLEVKRISGVADIVPLTISERLFNLEDKCTGTVVRVSGQFRSFNKHEENKNRLVLSVFVREIERVVNDYDEENEIEIDGFVCKNPVYRKTPLGREIADILFAVNRSYGKSDYIPCIVWGRNAVYTSGLPVGTHLKLTGRIQSRGYVKMHEDGTEEQRTAYEVSVSKINVLEEEN